MSLQGLSDTEVFERLVKAIWETDPNMSVFQVVDMLIDGQLADFCDMYYFYADDGQVSEDEDFLLKWMPTQAGNEDFRKELIPLAREISRR